MKGLPICFSEVQVKNDVTDNNNKHFVTAFEGECRNIIELREHLKLCFLIILYDFIPMRNYSKWEKHKYTERLCAFKESFGWWSSLFSEVEVHH